MTGESSKANSFQTLHGMGSGPPDLFDLMPLRALYTICVSTSRCSGTGKNEPGIIWGNGTKSAVRPAKKVLKLLATQCTLIDLQAFAAPNFLHQSSEMFQRELVHWCEFPHCMKDFRTGKLRYDSIKEDQLYL